MRNEPVGKLNTTPKKAARGGGLLCARGPILAIVALALVLRLATIAADTGYLPEQDAWDYDRHARSIADGDGFPDSYYVLDRGPSALRAPGYPYFLGTLYAVSGNSIAVGRFANAALGALAVFLLYLIASRVWGRRVGLLAAILMAVFPPLVLLSRELLSEPLFIVLELGMVLSVLEFRRLRELRWAALAGLLFGLAALTRNPGPALAIPLVLGLWVLRPRLSRRAAMAPAVALLCAVLVIAPWTVRNATEFGRFIPITSGTGFAMAGTYNGASQEDDADPGSWRTPRVAPEYTALFLTPGIDEGTLDATLRSKAIAFALGHPLYVAQVTGWNLLRLFELSGGSVVDPFTGPVETRGIGSADPLSERVALALAVLLAVAGAVAIVRSRRPAVRRIATGPRFLWLVPILLILVAAPINGLPRQRTPVDPFILILAAIGLAWLWKSRREDRVSTA